MEGIQPRNGEAGSTSRGTSRSAGYTALPVHGNATAVRRANRQWNLMRPNGPAPQLASGRNWSTQSLAENASSAGEPPSQKATGKWLSVDYPQLPTNSGECPKRTRMNQRGKIAQRCARGWDVQPDSYSLEGIPISIEWVAPRKGKR
jgi:hypothetical protein